MWYVDRMQHYYQMALLVSLTIAYIFTSPYSLCKYRSDNNIIWLFMDINYSSNNTTIHILSQQRPKQTPTTSFQSIQTSTVPTIPTPPNPYYTNNNIGQYNLQSLPGIPQTNPTQIPTIIHIVMMILIWNWSLNQAQH